MIDDLLLGITCVVVAFGLLVGGASLVAELREMRRAKRFLDDLDRKDRR